MIFIIGKAVIITVSCTSLEDVHVYNLKDGRGNSYLF